MTAASPRNTLKSTTGPTAKAGIDIRILAGTGGRDLPHPRHHHQARCAARRCTTTSYIGENCNVDIVAGCGIHNCRRARPPSHDGVHTFHIGKNSHVHYVGKATTARATVRGEQDHESPDHRLSGGGRFHPDGHRPDPGRGLHQARHQDRRAARTPRPSSPSGC